jgi:hypothetical protein
MEIEMDMGTTSSDCAYSEVPTQQQQQQAAKWVGEPPPKILNTSIKQLKF